VLNAWQILAKDARDVYDRTDASAKAAFFELMLHPIEAGENIHMLYIAAAKNNMYARQGRNSANFMAEETLRAFRRDHDLSKTYNELLNRKWNHMMDQTHIGYTYWQQPMRQMTPPLQYVQALEGSLSGDMRVSVEGQSGAIPGDDQYNKGVFLPLPTSTPYSYPRWVDISNTGLINVTFQVRSDPFVKVSQSSGTLSVSGERSDIRIFITIDWAIAPAISGAGSVVITGISDKTNVHSTATVSVPYMNTTPPNGYAGFVEADGYISFDAWTISDHILSRSFGTREASLMRILDYGIMLWPLSTRSLDISMAPMLEVPIWTFSTIQNTSITLYFAPSLNTDRDNPMRYAISIDDAVSKVVQLVQDRPSGELPLGWDHAVSQERWESKSNWPISPGVHKISIKLLDVGLILKKVIVNMGGLKQSSLGPPSSKWVGLS
jgi:Gylcosyl hydrolase family 115 C-terminal domain